MNDATDSSTQLLTCNRGWIDAVDVTIEDTVLHPTGQPVRVEAVSPVLRNLKCFNVTTTDGRSVVVEADHLWQVTDKRLEKSKGAIGARTRWFSNRVITTEQMITEGLSRYSSGYRTTKTDGKIYQVNEYRFAIPQQNSLQMPDQELLIDPYLFGAWLGDGTAQQAALTCHTDDLQHWTDTISSCGFIPKSMNRPETPNTFRVGITCEKGPGRHQRSFGGQLRKLGVLNNKHIPLVYLTGSESQRLALLQGLLDTDGSIDQHRGTVEFCTTTHDLADGVLFLSRSLGWRATLHHSRAKLYGRDCGPKHRVTFTPKRVDGLSPFRLNRKAQRVQTEDRGAGRKTVSVKAIEQCDSIPIRRITVSSNDGMFLLGRDLVATSESLAAESGKQLSLFAA